MALLNTYSAANRQLLEGKCVTYSARRVQGWWTWESTVGTLDSHDEAWEITRHCTMHYKYVGMNLGTANQCAAALLGLFNRTTTISVWDTDRSHENFSPVDGGTQVMADIVVRQTVGPMYEVDVSVNEVDTRMQMPPTVGGLQPLANYFTTENARSYYL